MKRALVIGALLLSSCAALRSWIRAATYPPEPPRPDASLSWWNDEASNVQAPVSLEGTLLRAIYVALSDYTTRMGNPDGHPPGPCLARFDAWDAQLVEETQDSWSIAVRLQEWRCYDAGGGRLLHVGATYVISKADFSIIAAYLGGEE